ncbi:MAG: histidine phosphatase family protein [Pseudomonadota bacterium]
MKRLILIRHAKSSWDFGGLSDHERPLNPRGQEACSRIAGWLQKNDYRPDEVLCSTATRCRETYDRIAAKMGLDVPISHLQNLYHASAESLLACLRSAEGETVMMLAHNPGIGDFAALIHAHPLPQTQQFALYPTAATTVMDFDIADWTEAAWDTGKGLGFVIPRELEPHA